MLKPGLLLSLLLISTLGSRPAAALWDKQPEQPNFTSVSARVSRKGQGTAQLVPIDSWVGVMSVQTSASLAGSLTDLQKLASGETFVNKLLGTDCFTKSLSIINKDCSKLDLEKKSRLAMALAICHLEQLGLPAFTCRPLMSLKQCADSINSDRQYTTYMEFLSNIDS